jgi:hypothetical protein
MTPLSSALFRRRFDANTQTTNLFLVEDLEDVGRTGELAENRVNDELTEQLVKGHEDIFYGYGGWQSSW